MLVKQTINTLLELHKKVKFAISSLYYLNIMAFTIV